MSTINKTIITASLAVLPVISLTTPVHAQSMQDYSDGTEQVAEINKIMNQIKESGNEIKSDMTDISSQFSQLSDKYSQLSSKYGTIDTESITESCYMDYLSNLQDANEQTQYDKKLKAIQKSDISISDATLSATYSKLRKNIKSTLNKAGINASDSKSATTSKKAKTNKANRDTLLSISKASKKYSSLVSDYKDMVSNGETISSSYASDTTASKAVQQAGKAVSTSNYDTSQSGFIPTSDLFNKINQKMSTGSSGSENTSNNSGSYSSISAGIKGK